MTIAEAKHKVVSLAQAEVGYQEGTNNWNKYAQEIDQLGITWGKKQNMMWCGIFVMWVFYKCFGVAKSLQMQCSGNPSSIPACADAARYFKQANRWHMAPELGDVVFFNVNGTIGHTGIVVRVDNNTIYTVEGNCGDAVSACKYTVTSPYVAGFGRPKWEIATEEKVAEPIPQLNLPLLKKGSKGETVRAAQFLLNGRGASCGVWGADGDFGNATKSAVEAFQRRNNLEADGEIGNDTWAKLLGLG